MSIEFLANWFFDIFLPLNLFNALIKQTVLLELDPNPLKAGKSAL